MPVPTSPVRPVPTTARRVRTWLPLLPPAIALVAIAGWLSFSSSGAGAAAPVVAWASTTRTLPLSCEDPQGLWAAYWRGEAPAGALERCAPGVVDDARRRLSLHHRVRDARAPRALRIEAMRTLLIGRADETPALASLLSGEGHVWPELWTPHVMAASAFSLERFAREAPLAGALVRVRMLELPESDSAEVDRSWLRDLGDELREDERSWLLAEAGELPKPGSDLSPPGPSSTPPPAAEGLLALATERSREEAAWQLAAAVSWVRAGAPSFASPPTPERRWAIWIDSREDGAEGPLPRASVFAVLHGRRADPAIGALTAIRVAEEAGMAVSARAEGGGWDVRAGEAVVHFEACGARLPIGGRWRGGADEQGTPAALERAAHLALAGEALRDGDGELAANWLPSDAPDLWRLAAALAAMAPPPQAGVAAPVPTLLRPVKRPAGRRARGGPPAPPAPAAAAAPSTPPAAPPGPPAGELDRVIAAGWAITSGNEAWARAALSLPLGVVAGQPAGWLRARLLLALGEPGGFSAPAPSCLDTSLPWPPQALGG